MERTDQLKVHKRHPYRFTLCDGVLLYDKDLSDQAKMTYQVLLSFDADNDGSVFPGQKKLAVFMGVSERSIRDRLKELEKNKWLKITRRSHTSNIYTLLMKNGKNMRPAPREFFSSRKNTSEATGRNLPITAEADFRVNRLQEQTTPTEGTNNVEKLPDKAVLCNTTRTIPHSQIRNGKVTEGDINVSPDNPLSRLDRRQWVSITEGISLEEAQLAADYIGVNGCKSPSGFRYDLPSTAYKKCLEGMWWKTGGGESKDGLKDRPDMYVAEDGFAYKKGEGPSD